MLKIAIPNKGALSEGAFELLKAAGYNCRRYDRELAAVDAENDMEFFFLRPKDIAIYVGNGILDLGITGRDLAVNSRSEVVELLPLNFGKSNFHYAVPQDSDLDPDKFDGVRVATSYPNIVADDLKRRGSKAEIIPLDGAVEISIRLGVADAIADVVESGRTLTEAGLRKIGGPILKSEAVLVARNVGMAAHKDVDALVKRLRGIILARSYAMIEYDIPREALQKACAITPGIESPTIAPLSKEGWCAVKSMVKRDDINAIMDALQTVGAKGVIVTDIRTCRI